MVPASLSRYLVDIMTGCREHPLPAPLLACVRILAFQGIVKAHATQALPQVLLMLALHGLQVSQERVLRSSREHCVAILVALAGADHDLVLTEVDIFDSQAATLHEPQSSTIQKHRH